MAILVLAANTAYSDFPRLSYFLARDRFMPRQFTFRGDRLAFSTGIVTLGLLSGRGAGDLQRRDRAADPALRGRRLHLVHPLPVRHGHALAAAEGAGLAARAGDQPGRRRRDRRWSRSSSPSPSSPHGAWIVDRADPVADPGDARHPPPLRAGRDRAGRADAARPGGDRPHGGRAGGRGQPGRAADAGLRPLDLRQRDRRPRHRRRRRRSSGCGGSGTQLGADVPLVIIESPYRSLVGPLLAYIDEIDKQRPDDT